MTKGIFFSHLFLRGYSLFPHVKKNYTSLYAIQITRNVFELVSKKETPGQNISSLQSVCNSNPIGTKKNVFPYYQPLNRLRTF